MTESDKDTEIARLRERGARLDALLGECLRHHYYDDAQVSQSWLADAKRTVWPVHKPKQWLFPGDRVDSCISSDAVELACQKAHQRCGIPKPVTPHSLRHYLPFRTMSCIVTPA